MICAFTGHRPGHLPWGGDETDARCVALKELLRRRIEEAAGQGCTEFLCGMARGCDTYFAEAVLALRSVWPELRLTAMLPCPDQAARWPEEDLARHRALCARCDRVEVLEPSYSPGCMLRRNYAMVERAQMLITVYDGSGGGTGSTVRYARRCGLRLLPVWL